MSAHNEILKEDKKWYQAFKEIPVVGNCDSGCGEPAKYWFGNTSVATCGSETCIEMQQQEYNNM